MHRYNVGVISNDIYRHLDKEPVDKQYKTKMNERRRVLLQENEDDDTEVIFWDDNTKPEDVFQGNDLEDYYRTQRQWSVSDTSSTDVKQRKHFDGISKALHVDPQSIPGYITFFKEGQNPEDGIPSDLQNSFDYYNTILENHPELQQDFDRWKEALDQLMETDVTKLSAKEFQERAHCPDSILKYVDASHRPLFEIDRKDFVSTKGKSSSSQVPCSR